jgi:hypothetical protein
MNIAAMCRCGHHVLIPAVEPVCLRIIQDPRASDSLRGNSISFLANVSVTLGQELRALGVADVLLQLVFPVDREQLVPEQGRSVAESVIVYCCEGAGVCPEIDRLMAADLVSKYCVPLLTQTLNNSEFRSMYPFLVFSARVFTILASVRKYAERLVADPRVPALLVQAVNKPVLVTSDRKGQRLALEALASLARFRLWVPTIEPPLDNPYAGIRTAAAKLMVAMHPDVFRVCLLAGHRVPFPRIIWQQRVLPMLFPFLLDGQEGTAVDSEHYEKYSEVAP